MNDTPVIWALRVDDIYVVSKRREVDPETVSRLAASISEIGLQYPITVRHVKDHVDPVTGEIGGAYGLVTGRHRLEAVRSLDWTYVPSVVLNWDDIDIRRWEISENLHRVDLTALERAEQIAEWIRLTEEKQEGVLRQLAAKPQGGRPEGGVRAASRELGIEERAARRAKDVASIAPEAKAAAVEAGLDNNQSALLKVAALPKEQQVAKVLELRPPKVSRGSNRSQAEIDAEKQQKAEDRFQKLVKQIRALSAEDFERLCNEVLDRPIMDRSIG